MIDPAVHGPWALIAGGSEGVGASFAYQLGWAGMNLVLIARKPGPLEETAATVRRSGAEVRTLALDLLDPATLDRTREVTDGLEVGLLIFNAGANSYDHEFLTGELDGVQRVIDLNITAPLAFTHHFGRAMRDRGRGGIIMVGSMAGYLGAARQSTYGGVKAFGRIFAEGLWLELRDHGVDVLELVLGVTRTPAMARAGLNLDLPGLNVAESDDIAAEGLAHLQDGPVWVAAGNAAAVEKRNGPDRARLVLNAHEAMLRLLPPST